MGIAAGAATPFHGFHGASVTLLVAAAVAAAAWLLLFATRWFASFPDLPAAGPETTDLGPEPPAVVNLLVNRWHVTRAAMPATLVDLAARKVVGLEEVGPDRFVVRVKPGAASPSLSDCEHQILHLVETKAAGGSAPVEVLTPGEEGQADAFFERFAKSVEGDARDRGLARRRWSRVDFVLLGAGLFVALELFALALGLAHFGETVKRGADGVNHRSGRWDPLGEVLIAWVVVMVVISRMRALRDTPAGRAACARWLGVRAYLRHDGTFADQPPAGVAIWGRMLSYGVALGVARAAAAAIPLGADDPRVAWSREGGSWHQVRVEYPHRFGSGEAPLGVFLGGVVRTLFWGAIGVVVLPVFVDVLVRALDEVTAKGSSLAVAGIVALVALVPTAMGAYVAVHLLDGVMRAYRGGADLGRHVTVEGEVVKLHDGHVAIDPGHVEEVAAFVPPAGGTHVHVGQQARATMTPHLLHCTSLEALDGGGATQTAAMTAPASPTTTATPTLPTPEPFVDRAALAAATGLALEPVDVGRGGHDDDSEDSDGDDGSDHGGRSLRSFPGGAVQVFSAPGGGHVAVMRTGGGPAATIAHLLGRRAEAAGTPVSGVGDRAFWVRGRQLLVHQGDTVVAVDVALPGHDEQQCLDVARTAATLALGGAPAPSPAPATPTAEA